jgi:hypothetical protein
MTSRKKRAQLHNPKNKAPDLQRGLWPWTLGHMGGGVGSADSNNARSQSRFRRARGREIGGVALP